MQQKSMSCSDEDVMTRRNVGALLMATACLFSSATPWLGQISRGRAAMQMLGTSRESPPSSWSGPMPPPRATLPHLIACVLCSLHCCIICLMLQRWSRSSPNAQLKGRRWHDGPGLEPVLAGCTRRCMGHSSRMADPVPDASQHAVERPHLILLGLLQLGLLPCLPPDAERDPQQPQCPAVGTCRHQPYEASLAGHAP